MRPATIISPSSSLESHVLGSILKEFYKSYIGEVLNNLRVTFKGDIQTEISEERILNYFCFLALSVGSPSFEELQAHAELGKNDKELEKIARPWFFEEFFPLLCRKGEIIDKFTRIVSNTILNLSRLQNEGDVKKLEEILDMLFPEWISVKDRLNCLEFISQPLFYSSLQKKCEVYLENNFPLFKFPENFEIPAFLKEIMTTPIEYFILSEMFLPSVDADISSIFAFFFREEVLSCLEKINKRFSYLLNLTFWQDKVNCIDMIRIVRLIFDKEENAFNFLMQFAMFFQLCHSTEEDLIVNPTLLLFLWQGCKEVYGETSTIAIKLNILNLMLLNTLMEMQKQVSLQELSERYTELFESFRRILMRRGALKGEGVRKLMNGFMASFDESQICMRITLLLISLRDYRTLTEFVALELVLETGYNNLGFSAEDELTLLIGFFQAMKNDIYLAIEDYFSVLAKFFESTINDREFNEVADVFLEIIKIKLLMLITIKAYQAGVNEDAVNLMKLLLEKMAMYRGKGFDFLSENPTEDLSKIMHQIAQGEGECLDFAVIVDKPKASITDKPEVGLLGILIEACSRFGEFESAEAYMQSVISSKTKDFTRKEEIPPTNPTVVFKFAPPPGQPMIAPVVPMQLSGSLPIVSQEDKGQTSAPAPHPQPFQFFSGESPAPVGNSAPVGRETSNVIDPGKNEFF